MNIVLSVIIATGVIAAMILFRIVATESVVRDRLRARLLDADCDLSSCQHGCGSAQSAAGSARDCTSKE